MLNGCSSFTASHQDTAQDPASAQHAENAQTDTGEKANRVELAPSVWVTLPTPAELGASLTATQLISAAWNDQQNQLPVQLEVTPEKLVLAGFSSWGARILSLTYQDQALSTDVLPGLGGVLPKPEQVLMNMMLTLWPQSAWQPSLQAVGWQLVDRPHQRQLLDNHGQVIVDIHYAGGSEHVNSKASDRLNQGLNHGLNNSLTLSEKLGGDIVFTHRQLGYRITIKTMNFQAQPLNPLKQSQNKAASPQ
ncbi:DUF3261 domain-containing protein [Photobacterium aphoticum]|nr:DUF3261 domain-containing protein [Photobacterium aphoticum]